MLDDIYFMKQALIEAGKAAERGEVPVGAVVVCKYRLAFPSLIFNFQLSPHIMFTKKGGIIFFHILMNKHENCFTKPT